MTRVVVTGGSGKVGRACIKDLLAHGYDVANLDTVPPQESLCPFTKTDLTDFGQVMEGLWGIDDRYQGVDAVVHMAAIPAPGREPNNVIFENNMLSTYNIFEAARRLGIKNVVWASSETVLGLPFDTPPPYAPVDEDYPGRPESAYSLSKLLSEEMAKQFCRWDPEMKIIGLRFSNVMEPQDYENFPGFDADPRSRHFNLWTYIDARDGSQAIRLALESDIKGAEVFGIANAQSVMSRANDALLDEVFPNTERKRAIEGNESLISIDKARRLLGYEPQYPWRDQIKA